MKKLIIVFIVVLCLINIVHGAEYYVDKTNPSCNDAGSGISEAQPWCTLHRATDGTPSLEHGGVAGTFAPVQAGDTVYVKHGTYEDIGAVTTGRIAYRPVNSGTASQPIAFRAYLPPSGERHRPVLLWAGLNRAVAGVRGGQHYIVWDGFAIGSQNHMEVWGCTGCIIENMLIDPGPATWGGGATGLYRGIHLENNFDVIVRNNVIRNSYYLDHPGDANGACIMMYHNTRTRIHNNDISNCTAGIYPKADSVSDIYELNYIHDIRPNGQAFLFNNFGGRDVENNILRHNLIVNAPAGIAMNVRNARSNQFYSNTFYNVVNGIGSVFINNTPSLNVYNNIIVREDNIFHWEKVHYLYLDWNHIGPDYPTTLLSDYSDFYGVSGPQARFSPYDGVVETLSQWQSRGFDTHSLTSNPQFVGPLTGTLTPEVFKLQSTSPLRGAGRVGGLSTGSPVNIGAYAVGNEVIGLTSGSFPVITPSQDTTPPTTPTGLTATAVSSSQINLAWNAATDNVAVTGYRIYRGGVQIATSTTRSYVNTGLSPSTSYSYTVAAYDAAGNVGVQSTSVSATTQAVVDTTPPVRSNPSPLGTLAAGTTSTTLSLTTNEAATCRYSTIAGTAYSSMTNSFSTTGSTSHSTTVSGLTNGRTYNYYVKCIDTVGNANTNEYVISFSVANQTVTPPPPPLNTTTLWTNRNSIPSQGDGDGYRMVWASVPQKVIVYDGKHPACPSPCATMPQMWAYDYASNVWTNLNPPFGPGPLDHFPMAYDSRNDRIILLSKWDGSTWAYYYNTNTWTNRNPAGTPQFINHHVGAAHIAYDSESDRTILVMIAQGISETWAYNYAANTWTNMNPSVPRPNPHWTGMAHMIYVPNHDRVLLIANADNRMWAYDYNANRWEQRAVAPARDTSVYPGATFFMAYDSESDKILWYGDDRVSWVYDWTSDSWTNVNAFPSPGSHHADLVYVPATDRILHYGGGTPDFRRELWEFNYNAYGGPTPTTPPAPSFDFSLSNAGSRSVVQGNYITNTITTTLVSGTSQTVTFSTSGLPTGATVSYAPTSCSPACSTTLTITTSASMPIGTYTITIRGTSGSITRTTSFSLIVSAVSSSPSPDTTPPIRSSSSPTGTLPAGTTSTPISLTTNEAATCRYSTIAGTAYSSMTNTFATTGSTSHSTSVSGLSNGNTYTYYVRCRDAVGNANINDFAISFGVMVTRPQPLTLTIASTADTYFRLGYKPRLSFKKDHISLAQSFVALASSLTEIRVGLAKTRNPKYPITVSISSSLTGTPLYQTTIHPFEVKSSSISAPTWVTVPVFPTLSLTQGDTYYLILSVDMTQSGHYYKWPVSSVNPYSNGTFYLQSTSQSQYDSLLALIFAGIQLPSPPPPPLDSQAPSQVTGLTATPVSSTQINLAWNTATDNIGVTGYKIYRFGTQIATAASTSYSNTGLSPSTSYSYTVAAVDAAGNVGAQSTSVSATTQAALDTTHPVRSNGQPLENLPAGTTQTTLFLTTNEAATCRYSTTANTPYASLINTFSTTGSTSHSTTVSGLSNGNTYRYYVRCQDAIGNANIDDFTITFSIVAYLPLPSGACTNYVDSAMGNDANTGTSESASWATLQRAMSVPTGSTVCVKEGTYTVSAALTPANSGTASDPIAFRAYTPPTGPRHRPIIHLPGTDPAGSNLPAITANDRHYIIWDGFQLGPWNMAAVYGRVGALATGNVFENLLIDKGPSVPAVCGQNNYDGIFAQLTDGLIIRNNVIRNVIYSGCDSQNAAGIVLYDTRNTRVHNNEIYNTNTGIYDKENGVGNIHERNYIHDVRWHGVLFNNFVTSRCGSCPVEDNTVRQNIFVNVDRGVRVAVSSGVVGRDIHVYNNVFYNVRMGVYGGAIPGQRFYNNIMVVRDMTAGKSGDYVFYNNPPADLLSDYSNFRSGNYPQSGFMPQEFGALESLAQWQTRGFDLNSLSVDPQFVGPLTTISLPSAFRLQSSSPLRNSGRVGGVSAGAATAIGAYITGDEVIGPGGAPIAPPLPPPPPPPPAFDFSLSNGGSSSVTQGASVSNAISATIISGTTQSVSFSAAGLPTGSTASFSPTSCSPTCTTTFTISTTSSTAPGSYSFLVSATGGSLSRNTSFVLTVNTPVPPPPLPPSPAALWRDLSPVSNAGNKDGHNIAYDSESQRVIIYGDHGATETHETWAYNYTANAWTNMNPVTNPGSASHSTMTYDSAHDRVLLFNRYTSTLWEYNYNTNTWTNRNPSPSPAWGSYGASIAYDSESDHTVLFSFQTGETWTYHYMTNSWTNMDPPKPRPAADWRRGTNAVYLNRYDRVVLISNIDNRMWAYDYNTNLWSRRATAPTRSTSGGAQYIMAYDSESDKILWYGDDRISWVYDWTGDAWTNLDASPGPYNHHANLVYAPTFDRILFYGGCRWPAPCPGERFTWEFNYNQPNV